MFDLFDLDRNGELDPVERTLEYMVYEDITSDESDGDYDDSDYDDSDYDDSDYDSDFDDEF